VNTIAGYKAERRRRKAAYEQRAAFDDGHGRQLRVVKTKRAVRLHIEDTNRGTNADIVLHPTAVAWLVARVTRLDGGRTAMRRRAR